MTTLVLMVFLITLVYFINKSAWRSAEINGFAFEIPVSWILESERREDGYTLWSILGQDQGIVVTLSSVVSHPSYDVEGVPRPNNEKYLSFINQTVSYSVALVADQSMYTFYEYDDCSIQRSLIRRTCPPNSNYFSYTLRDFLGYDEALFALFLDNSIPDKDSALNQTLAILENVYQAAAAYN